MMFKTRAIPRSPGPANLLRSVAVDVDDPDRRVLHSLLSFLLAAFDRVRTRTRTGPDSPTTPAAWLDHWQDQEYVYLETRVPGDTSGLELDLHLHNGVIFARVLRREDEDTDRLPTVAEAVEPSDDRRP